MNDRTHILRRAVATTGVLLLFLGAVLLVTIYFLPRVYFAKVTIEVKSDVSSYLGVFEESPAQRQQAFIATQISLLRSKEILNQVIKNLALDVSWAKDEQPLLMEQAFVRLANSLELRDLGGKGMIEIGVYDTDPQEAANIANTIAVVYQQKRLADLQRNIDVGMKQLGEEVEKQRMRADEAAVDMAKIRERFGVVDPTPNDYGSTLGTSKEIESRIPSIEEKSHVNDYIEAKTRFLQAKRIYEAAQTKYSTEVERVVDFDPVKIWEKAEPPVRPTRLSVRQLRHAFSR